MKRVLFFCFFSFVTIHTYATQDYTTTCTPSATILSQENVQNDTLSKTKEKIQTSYLTTVERTILKLIIETFWGLLKTNRITQEQQSQNHPKKYPHIDYYELCKIISNLAIDEVIQKEKNSITQNVIELLVPKAISIILIKEIRKEAITSYQALATDIVIQLFFKLVMVRFFQTPGTQAHRIANIAAFFSPFLEKQDPNSLLPFINIQNATEKIPLDLLRTFIQSQNVDFGDFFNVKHRKKAFAKIMQVLLHPTLQIMAKEIGDFIISNLPQLTS
jgi:hypothetical protein